MIFFENFFTLYFCRLKIITLFLSLSVLLTIIQTAMPRVTETIPMPINGIGIRHFLTVHRYGSAFATEGKIYIQASLHADEIPGLLVSNHLIHLLDEAEKANAIQKEIVIVPYANPIGLSQILMGSHLGRFSLDTGVNFNRDWLDVTTRVAERISGKLKTDDAAHNVRLIRDSMKAEAERETSMSLDKVMKRTLYKIACDADIVLDLHCDTGLSIFVISPVHQLINPRALNLDIMLYILF